MVGQDTSPWQWDSGTVPRLGSATACRRAHGDSELRKDIKLETRQSALVSLVTTIVLLFTIVVHLVSASISIVYLYHQLLQSVGVIDRLLDYYKIYSYDV